jgi:hypothetical protein
MRKSVVVVAISAAVIAWPAVDVATMGTGRADEGAVTLGSRVKRETRYYGIGPSAHYDFDAGSIGEVRPLRVPFASGSPVDVVITISMDYRTSADDEFVVAPLVRRNGRFGPVVRTRPRGRVVAASTTWTSSTTAFLIGGLRGVASTGSLRPSTSPIGSGTAHRSRAGTWCSSWTPRPRERGVSCASPCSAGHDATRVLAQPPSDAESVAGDQAVEAIRRPGQSVRDRRDGPPTGKCPNERFGECPPGMDGSVRRDDVCRCQPRGDIQLVKQDASLVTLDGNRPHPSASVPPHQLVHGPSTEAAVFVIDHGGFGHTSSVRVAHPRVWEAASATVTLQGPEYVDHAVAILPVLPGPG